MDTPATPDLKLDLPITSALDETVHSSGSMGRSVNPSSITHVVGDQSAVMTFLQAPSTHGLKPGERVERIDTHGAVIFLAGKKAYKIKRAVCLPFMDFSTLARREEACQAEIDINRPTAPEIYINKIAITRDRLGDLALNGRGEAIEWAVAMHRFDPSQTFDRLAQDGALTQDDLLEAVDAIIAFQRRAPERRVTDWISDLGSYIEQNDRAFHEATGQFAQKQTAELKDKTTREWKRVQPVLQARGKRQKVRRCHGDLHLRNIVRLPEGVRLFDALEFDERIATGDVLYDLAFMLMSLDELNLREEANGVLNHYIARMGQGEDMDGLDAFPLFLSIRAALRAKISAMAAHYVSGSEHAALLREAKHFFDYALDVLEARDVSLTVVGGLSGSGKSAVASALAPRLGRSPGAVILRSDITRKTLSRAPWTKKLGPDAYTPDMTRHVYETMAETARHALLAGHAVIVDAVCATLEEREMFEQVARDVECHFAGVWLDAKLDTRLTRIDKRVNDASDADGSIARKQESYAIDDLAWPRANADQTLDKVLATVRPLVDRLN